jgi:hypothetical protein
MDAAVFTAKCSLGVRALAVHQLISHLQGNEEAHLSCQLQLGGAGRPGNRAT